MKMVNFPKLHSTLQAEIFILKFVLKRSVDIQKKDTSRKNKTEETH